MFDPYNMFLYEGLNSFEVLKKVSVEKIFAVHINDAEYLPSKKYTQEHLCFCGMGILDLGDYLSVLKEVGYDSMVSIELFRPEYWSRSAEWVIKKAYSTTKSCMEKYLK